MLRDFNTNILDVQGNPIVTAGKPMTVREAIGNALHAALQGEQPNGDEKYKRFQLSLKIETSDGKPDLTTEDLSRIKDVVGKAFGPLVVGRVFDLLDQKMEAVKTA
jgi:hypothetical protein